MVRTERRLGGPRDASDRLARRRRRPHSAESAVGNSAVVGSLAMVRRHGRPCLAGFLGGLDPIPAFMPMMQMPSGVHFSVFGSYMFGAPARVFRFEEIREAHRLMEAGAANGKIVVRL